MAEKTTYPLRIRRIPPRKYAVFSEISVLLLTTYQVFAPPFFFSFFSFFLEFLTQQIESFFRPKKIWELKFLKFSFLQQIQLCTTIMLNLTLLGP